MLSPKTIDIITNIVSFVLFMWEPVSWYFGNQPFSVQTFVPMLLTSIIAYFTGKSGAAALRSRAHSTNEEKE